MDDRRLPERRSRIPLRPPPLLRARSAQNSPLRELSPSREIASVSHKPVSVLIADVRNGTNDPIFDRTLEPLLKAVLERAGFITAVDRTQLSSRLGVQPFELLNEVAAREVAVKQGLDVVLSGSIDRRAGGYEIAVKAIQTIAGDVACSKTGQASSRDQVLRVTTKLATDVRKALGDDTSNSARMFATISLSTTSLEAVRFYALAQEAMASNRHDEARQNALKAVELDPKFGVGYQLLAVASNNLDQPQDAEKYIRDALCHLDGMTERERLSTRGMFCKLTGDYQQAVKEYGDMVSLDAASVSAHNQLALCYVQLRDFRKAVDEMRKAVELVPKRALFRTNLALFATYAGDFQTGEREARIVQDLGSPQWGLYALAEAQLGQGRLPEAVATYHALAKVDAKGASQAASGLGDVAIYEGRFSDAVRILEQGAAADLASGHSDRAAAKFAALAYAHVLQRHNGSAVAAIQKALVKNNDVGIRFLAARTCVGAGELLEARALMTGLASEFRVDAGAYAKIVEAEIALKSSEVRQAVKLLTEANGLIDTWIGHFDLGRAYFEVGQLVQADSEFDRCIKRRGEALSLFLNEVATFGYLPPVYYYQGRIRETLKTEGFAESYRTYLSIRGTSNEDPLVQEVRRRVGVSEV